MEINPSLNISYQDQQIQKLKQDEEKAGEIFEKILLQKMMKEMYKTTELNEKPSMEKEFYQEQMIDILSDKIVESRALRLKEKYLIDQDV